MNEKITKQDADEASLILKHVNGFIDDARYLDVKDMTAFMGAFIETAVDTLAHNTSPDTALQVLSQILLELAPRCAAGSVTVFHDGNNPLKSRQ